MGYIVGSKYTVRLGEHRGHHYEVGLLPTSMLPDGTIVTIKAARDPKVAYSLIEEDRNFSYPLSLLFPIQTKRQRLHEAVRTQWTGK